MCADWNNEEEEEEEDDDEYKSFEDHIVFLIDSRKDMLKLNSKGEVILTNILKLLLAVLKSKIISSQKSCVGAIFYGTKHKSADSTVDGMYTLLSLDVPTAQRIKKVQAFVDNIDKFNDEIGSQEEFVTGANGKQISAVVPLKSALWHCSHEFNSKGSSFKAQDFKRVWLFTNDDNPNAKHPQEQLNTIQVARDAAETGVELSLWHLDKFVAGGAPSPFRVEIYYNKLLLVDEEELTFRTKGAGDGGFDTMLAQVRKKEFKKRKMGSLKVFFGSDTNVTTFSVQLFKTLNIMKKPYAINLYSKSNQPVIVRTKYLDSSTGDILSDEQISTFIDIQGERISFTANEMKAIKSSCVKDPGENEEEGGKELQGFVKILYFAPSTSLRVDLNISTPYFVFPDEKKVKGSGSMFAALLHNMLAKQVIAVGMFIRNKSSAPRLVTILPRMEKVDNEGFLVSPGGMYLIPLPYSGEVRSCANTTVKIEPQVVPEEDYVAANNLLNCFQIEPKCFSFNSMHNPSLQRFYTVIQAVALNEEMSVDQLNASDELWPDKNVLVAAQEPLLDFKAICGLTDVVATAPRKRAAPVKADPEEAPVAKKATKAKKDIDFDLVDSDDDFGKPKKAKKSAASGDIAESKPVNTDPSSLCKETVASLKDICKSLGLPVSGKKEELVQRIASHK